MRKLVLFVVNGEKNEYGRIMYLLAVGFCFGILFSTYDVATLSLFLLRFDEKEMLPYYFTASGVLGVVFTYLYTSLQKRMEYASFMVLIFGTIAVLVSASAIVTNIPSLFNEYTIFTIRVLSLSIAPIILLSFWGIFGRVFDLNTSKRLVSGIDTGQALSTIIGFFSVPIIIGYVSTTVLLYISATFAILMMVFVTVIVRKYPLVETASASTINVKSEKPKRLNHFIVAMSLVMIATIATITFLEYSYLVVTADFFRGNQERLTSYLSLFEGMIIIAAFVIQVFFNDKILEIYGTKVSLMLIPLVFLLFIIASLISGSIFGFSVDTEYFIFFFIVISVGKVFLVAFSDSLQNPVLKTFYFPLPVNIRFDIQARVDGIVNQSSTLFAGLLLIFLQATEKYDILLNSYVIIAIIIIWVISIHYLYREYTSVLQNTLSSLSEKETTEGDKDLIWESLAIERQTDFFKWYNRIQYLTSYDEELQLALLSEIRSESYVEFVRVIEDALKESEHLSSRVVTELEKTWLDLEQKIKEFSEDEHRALFSARDPLRRVYAARLLICFPHKDDINILNNLFQDPDTRVVKEAIRIATVLELDVFLPNIISYLDSHDLYAMASSSVLYFDIKAIVHLENTFNKLDQRESILFQVIIFTALIKHDDTEKFLSKSLATANRTLLDYVVWALEYRKVRVAEKQEILIIITLREHIANIFWNLSAQREINEAMEGRKELLSAMSHDRQRATDIFFAYLALVYDYKAVQLVKSNFKLGTSDSVSYATELLSMLVDSTLKSITVPIIEDITIERKIKKFESHYHREKLSGTKALIRIIGQDMYTVSRWAKACALYAYMQYDDADISVHIKAILFGNDLMLQELAAIFIYNKSPKEYNDITLRLPYAKVKKLDELVLVGTPEYLHDKLYTCFDKVKFLSRIDGFKHISPIILSDIVDVLEDKSFEEHTIIAEEKLEILFVVVEGSVLLRKNDDIIEEYYQGAILRNGYEQTDYFWVANAGTRIFRLSYSSLIKVISRHPSAMQEGIHKHLIAPEKARNTEYLPV